MTKALISIDYTYDFVADDGKLTAGKPAQSILKGLLVETYMVLWELYMKLLRKIVVFFG